MVILSLVLSAWLVASAFLLPHTAVSATLTAAAGAVAIAASFLGRERALARFLVTGAALAVSGLAVFLRTTPDVTSLHHAVVAPLLLVLSLLPIQTRVAREAHAGHHG
jgi:hypothetical protein